MKPLRILLADDDTQIRTMLRYFLEPEHEIVGTAADGETLLEEAFRLQPDVIITDVQMPRLSGLQALWRMHDIAPRARVIPLSSDADPDTMEAAFAGGASAYLVKGLTSDLRGALRSTIGLLHTNVTAPANSYDG